MSIRIATLGDAAGIGRLITQLGYPGTETFLEERLAAMMQDPDEVLLVWDASASTIDPAAPASAAFSGAPNSPAIQGFLSLHFIPQIALRGNFARISYFAVDEDARSQGIGRLLEDEATRLARERGCDRLEVHCATRRDRAHKFYARQGFVESPKYLIKKL